ncbi:hypothetical protein Rhopal_006328-T1 [Rhodotorula paludigena]|uniref:Carboxylic ester hydrolase n=1 Tax=Rhodotorula paludigena TaxID=86838 RepID=A0AAV5GUV0_9BASI|nr:hypothetical protein Rhopal_006328-T1 [Rhodotorula paludigena]
MQLSSLSLLASSLVPLAALPGSSASPVALTTRNNAGRPTAQLQNGTVRGVHLPTFAQDAFLGIPYAQPPVGDLRLRRPQPLEAGFDGGSFEAVEYSAFCWGIGSDNYGFEQSEDCLTLNVVRPSGTTADDKLPVGLWIYGGGFQQGGTADPRYNSSWIIQRSVEMEKPIIFVSVNYRVSSLGFLSSDELRAEGNVNLGLYDQRLAMQWLQDNIAAFGGDPEKVTIWGESAGAASVSYQLLGYGLTSTSLFRGAILESGSPTGRPHAAPETLQPRFEAILNGTDCTNAADVLACVRAAPLEQFNASASTWTWNPVVDGQLIAEYPSDSFRAGKFVKVPLLIGTNTDEGSGFGAKNITTDSELAAAQQAYYPKLTNSSVASLFELYPNDPSQGCPYNTGDGLLASGYQDKRSNALTGDLRYVAGRRLMAQKYVAADQAVYSYRFDQPAPNATIALGTAHFAEVAYVFSNPLPTQNRLGDRPGDAELAHLMTSQWISFIHDGTPNNHGVEGAETWPDYRTEPNNMLYRRQGSHVERDDFRADGIRFITELGWELSA